MLAGTGRGISMLRISPIKEIEIIKLHQVKEAGDFLLVMMPVMFVPSSVGFMTAFPVMKKYGLCFLVIAVVTTFCVMVITGQSWQAPKAENENLQTQSSAELRQHHRQQK